jgi:hypothetical protein
VYGALGDTPNIGFLIPTFIPQPERYVYEFVRDACGVPVEDAQRPGDTIEVGSSFPEGSSTPFPLPLTFNEMPPMTLFDNPTANGDLRGIPVVRGWPAYPGKVPSVGVALGNDSDDQATDVMEGGFAGDISVADPDGNPIVTGSYYSESLYSTIVVELIHENREERDRLHDELRRVLFPLRRRLLNRSPLMRSVRLDAEKDELPMDESPFVIYASIFTVHVYYEMLVAQDVVTAPDGLIEAIDLTVVPLPEPINQTVGIPVVFGGIVFATTEGAEPATGATFPYDGSGLPFTDPYTADFPVPPDTSSPDGT